MGAGSQGFRSSSSAFSGHKQRAGRELEQMVTNQDSYRISAHARRGLEPQGYSARPTIDSVRHSPFCEGKKSSTTGAEWIDPKQGARSFFSVSQMGAGS